ncbi:hypothetical protein MNBD_GAMMA02-914 [hydrothermal vent metagenome]|uniref:GDP-Man:Man(1)GlcNAc(2)-PP-Dol alpha-1,3-mannosyltransferase n=1 Tax=hydrothermal vent metagenome TaxID=652676 RepID=A0A3B0WUC8_9ZZZZ
MPSSIQVIHDLFQIKGGGERLIQTLCQDTGADLLTAHIGQDTFDLSQLPGQVQNLTALSSIHGIKTLSLARAFKNHRPRHSNYQQIIYSGVASPLAVHQYPAAKNIFYCHTPPRFVYDKRQHFSAELNVIKRQAFNALLYWFKPQYEAAVKKMDVVLTNSNYVKQRIQDSLGIDAEVIYPPCDTQHFKWLESGDYYLSMARHDELKRIDSIIQAFKQMPNKKLVVASGGHMTPKLIKLAADSPNITFTGWLDESQLLSLLGNCLATIYLPTDEDFGMSPVESMSAGKPVLCSDHGGLLESVLDKETGLYINNDNLINDLMNKVSNLDTNKAAAMRTACETRAKAFDSAIFLKKFQHFL